MKLKLLFSSILICFIFQFLSAQDRTTKTSTFGKITEAELEIEHCSFDLDAPALVLFEKGENTFEVINNYVYLVKSVHRKIKVFDSKAYDGASVKIPHYTPRDRRHERVQSLNAITHNGRLQKYLSQDDVYDIEVNEKWSEKRFSFPNVQDGSIIEYTYRLETPYFFNFGNWKFQSEIPKLYSEFNSSIPGNYIYRRSLIGNKKLDINTSKITKRCLDFPGAKTAADCYSSTYAMNNIPAYKEEEYMLSPLNYISRLNFEIESASNFRGETTRYTKSWDDVDREFKKEKDIGRQLKKVNYFKSVLPAEIIKEKDELKRAKSVYKFIKDHFTWNGAYRIFSEVRVKDAFETGIGNIAEINLSLINALNAANIKAELALSSTRDNGLPGTLHPVLTDFNYVLAFVEINDEKIFLDASQKTLSFGMISFEALNYQARVMDFKNPSFWHKIEPEIRNFDYLNIDASLTQEGIVKGTLKGAYGGYTGHIVRNNIGKNGMSVLEERIQENPDINILKTDITSVDNVDEHLKVDLTFIIETDLIDDILYFNPLLFNIDLKSNPFIAEERSFPIDLGYSRTSTYSFTLSLNNFYEVIEIPENQVIKLPENKGECAIGFFQNNDIVRCTFRFALLDSNYEVSEYTFLKDFFKKISALNNQSFIKLKKK